MVRDRKLLAVFSACFLLSACASTHQGRDFDTETVNAFVIGETTKADVLNTLGEPQSRTTHGTDTVMWTYNFFKTGSSALNPMTFLGIVELDTTHTSKMATLTFQGDVLSNMSVSDSKSEGGTEAFKK